MYRSSFGQLISFLLLGGFLTACTPQQPPGLETEIPTQQAPASPTGFTTSIADNQNSAEFIENIRIQVPGSDSRIASPILLQMLVSPSSTGVVRIELTSQAGSLLARQILSIDQVNPDEATELSVPIYFEINRASAEAQLIVSIEDQYGRLKGLDSAAITLLRVGANVVVTNDTANQIQITSPKTDDTLQGGSLTISGDAATQSGRPLNVELITREGRVLDFGETYPTFEDGNQIGTFSLTLDYEVEEPTWVLIGVAERQSGFIIHYASVEVLLLP